MVISLVIYRETEISPMGRPVAQSICLALGQIHLVVVVVQIEQGCLQESTVNHHRG